MIVLNDIRIQFYYVNEFCLVQLLGGSFLEKLIVMVLHSDFLTAGREGRNAAKTAVTVSVQSEIFTVTSATIDLLQKCKINFNSIFNF